jgi:hypothetical protein
MNRLLEKIIKQESGNAAVLVAAALLAMILMAGVVIDGGHLFMTKSHLQKAVNAAALSGAQELVHTEAEVSVVVERILASHHEEESFSEMNIDNESVLTVRLKKGVPLFFAALFGIDEIPIEVQAKAAIHPMGEGAGAVPLGVDESVTLEYGQTYELKVGAGDAEAGNFGVLALDGPGARAYEDTLKHGFEEPLSVGDIINTQTGNMAGPTREGVNYRMNQSPIEEGENISRDSSRIMLVLVYRPHEQSGNQLRSVKITGFAYFYLSDPMGDKEDSIRGTFIKHAGSGYEGENSPVNRGAYVIKLTE